MPTACLPISPTTWSPSTTRGMNSFLSCDRGSLSLRKDKKRAEGSREVREAKSATFPQSVLKAVSSASLFESPTTVRPHGPHLHHLLSHQIDSPAPDGGATLMAPDSLQGA